MAKDINSSPFDEGTKIKLDIFRRCFREWYPVFVHDLHTKHLFVFDMFAGSGMDTVGVPGSPLILLEEAKGADYRHCTSLKSSCNGKQVFFVFNEYIKQKYEDLTKNVHALDYNKGKFLRSFDDVFLSAHTVCLHLPDPFFL